MSILPIFIPHAGCPHQCVFCNQRTISGQRKPAYEGAKEQISTWLQWFKPGEKQEAAFYGGSFTALEMSLQESLLQLTDQLIEQKIIGRVRLSTRPDAITIEGIQLLKKHKVYLVEMGVQSLDNGVLKLAERGHSAEVVEEAMLLLKKAGLKTGIQLMVGMPGQSFASVKETVAKVIALKPDIARIYPLLVIKGTPLAKQYTIGGFQPLTVEEAVEQAAYMYQELTEAGIKVIRIGLQADEELCSPGNIVAGPYHPSMGELVKSRALRNKIEQALVSSRASLKGEVLSLEPIKMELTSSEGEKLQLTLEPKDKGLMELYIKASSKLHSQLIGMKKENLHYFAAKNIFLKLV